MMDLAKPYALIALVLWLLRFETGKDLCLVVCKLIINMKSHL